MKSNQKEIKIVAFGDSITNGVRTDGSVTESETFRRILEQKLNCSGEKNVKIINAGVNSDISTLALNRIEKDVLSYEPDWVTIMFGVNDAGFFRPDGPVADTPRVSKKDFEYSLKKIVEKIKEKGAQPILVTPVPMSPSYHLADYPPYIENGLNYLVDEYSDIIRRLAKDLEIPLIDVHKEFSENPETQEFVPDGIHPDKRGHKLISEIYFRKLNKLL